MKSKEEEAIEMIDAFKFGDKAERNGDNEGKIIKKEESEDSSLNSEERLLQCIEREEQ